jgi:MFS family permease
VSAQSPRWILTVLFSASLGVGLIFGFQPPLIALSLTRNGASGFLIGVVTAMSLVAIILLGPAYPAVIARWGLKGSIVAGLSLAAAAMLAMPFWTGIPAWMLLRFVGGCGLGLAWIASEVWMNTLSTAATRGAVMGIYGTIFSLGTAAGPALLQFTGTVGWQPFFGGVALLGLTALPLLSWQGGPVRAAADRPARGLVRLFAAAPVVMLAAAVAGLVESAELSLLPVYGLRAGLDEHTALSMVAVFLMGNVVMQLPIGLLADRYGRRLLLGICAALSALGPVLLPSTLVHPELLWVLLFMWGGTLYAFYSQGVALLGETFSPALLAAANTVFVMVYCLGGVMGPSLGGLAMDRWPGTGLPALLSAAPLLLLLTLLAQRTASRSA